MNFFVKKNVNDNHTIQYELNNGMKVVFTPSNKSSLVYCGFLFNVGSRNEDDNNNGIAHFIEHALFKGSKKRHSYQILNRIEAVGGELNAFTMREKTFYYTSSLKKYLDRSVELLFDLVFNPSFPHVELEKEKKVIIEEIEMYEDSPEESIYDDFTANLFKNDSLSHNILGTKKSVLRLKLNDVLNFWQKYYTPGNCIFSIVGSVSQMQIERILHKYFLNLEEKSTISNCNDLPAYQKFQMNKKKDFQQIHVIIGNRAYSNHDPQRYTLALINNVLGGDWMSSRLNMNLRERNAFAYNVSSGFNTYSDTGSFVIQFGTDYTYLNKSIEIVLKELKKIRDVKMSTIQLNKAKRQMESQHAHFLENHSMIMQVQARNLADFGRLISRQEYLNAINKINSNNILDVANHIFEEKLLSILVYSKEQNKDIFYC